MLRIVGRDKKFKNVVLVEVPGIYPKGKPLPRHMSKLVYEAAVALQKVYEEIEKEGGQLYISDMFRNSVMQQRAHLDWKMGRKASYSPPACSSVHEACRAIDIDAYDTKIGHKRVREILNKHGWVNIVKTLTGKECWHYEYRGERWEKYKQVYGDKAMVRGMKEEIGNMAGKRKALREEKKWKWLQESLNKVLGLKLVVDGVYGEKTRAAVRMFQEKYGLLVDGVFGPITSRKLNEVLCEMRKKG